MDNSGREALMKEIDFNIKYILEKYNVDSIAILISDYDSNNETIGSLITMGGNRYASIELCRKVIIEEEEVYKDSLFNNVEGEGDELY